MPLAIVRNDITKMKVDAIVSMGHCSLRDGGVNSAIRREAGPQLWEEYRALGGCKPGSVRITKGYRLPCRYAIHAVGPRFKGRRRRRRERLVSSYRDSLELAKAHGCETVAFSLDSSDVFGCPKDQALRIAMDAIGGFLLHHDMTVFLAVADSQAFDIGKKRFTDIRRYINAREMTLYATFSAEPRTLARLDSPVCASMPPSLEADREMISPPPPAPAFAKGRLEERMRHMDESFSEMLLRKIHEKGMTDAQCYKKANIDRKLFSKIRSDIHYRPSKPTALAFAVALELPLEEAKDMLRKAGFALSRSSRFDIIVEYFLEAGNYNIFEINEALFAFDQSLLGVYT